MEETAPLVRLEINSPDFHYQYHSDGKGTEYRANEVKPEVMNVNTSYEYSGRHDHGKLSQLKEDGYYANLISALKDVKRESDLVIQAQVTQETIGKQQQNQENDDGDGDEEENLNNEIDEAELETKESSDNEISPKKPRLHE